MKTPASISGTEKILKELKSGKFHPVYLLMGEEPYFIDQISDYIEKHALQPHEREFNQTVVYGLDTDPMDLVSVVKRYPMMAERQVVVLKEAQRMKNLDKLLEVVEHPIPTTTLVIAHKEKSLDKRTVFWKALAKHAVVLKSDRLRDYEITAWIKQHIELRGMKINAVAVQLLADHIGNDLERIVNELEKLAVALPGSTEITPAIIEKHVGISKDFNAFELQKAIGEKNTEKAFKIVKHMGGNPKEHPIIGTTAILFGFFVKLYQYHHLENKSKAPSVLRVPPYFIGDYEKAARNYPVQKLERIFGYLNETDLKAKGVNAVSADQLGLLQELVFKILN